jgi:hypothetical protein
VLLTHAPGELSGRPAEQNWQFCATGAGELAVDTPRVFVRVAWSIRARSARRCRSRAAFTVIAVLLRFWHVPSGGRCVVTMLRAGRGSWLPRGLTPRPPALSRRIAPLRCAARCQRLEPWRAPQCGTPYFRRSALLMARIPASRRCG